MNRMTAVGLCTYVVLASCALEDTRDPGAAPLIAAQQTQRGEQTVHGAVRGEYGGKPFTAVVTISEFVERGGAVRALGKLSATAGALGDDDVRALEGATLELPVVIGPAVRPQVVLPPGGGTLDGGLGAICDVLYVRLPAQKSKVEARDLTLEDVQLDVEAHPSVDSEIGRALCEASPLLEPGNVSPDNVRRAIALLNHVVALNRAASAVDAGATAVPALDAGPLPPAVAFDASTPLRM